MKKITEQKEVLLLKLQTLYDIEHELEKSLPKLAKAATDPELTNAFSTHYKETKNHIKRLEEIFELMGEKPEKEKSVGIRGIAEDSQELSKLNTSTQYKDTILASSARFAEHFEIAGYTSAILEAEQLGLGNVVDLLQQTLQEEMNADKALETSMSRNFQPLIV